MNNSLTVEIRFSFRGENFAPQATVELDEYLQKGQPIPPFFSLVARANQIDVYSYQYEVMEMGEYHYFNATGLAAEFCHGDRFDAEGFSAAWRQQRMQQGLQKIAREILDLENLPADDKIFLAMQQAYRLGQQQADS